MKTTFMELPHFPPPELEQVRLGLQDSERMLSASPAPPPKMACVMLGMKSMLMMNAMKTMSRDQVRKPHLDRIVAIEGLLNKGVHEAGPHEDESGGDGANHGEADKHIKEVKELASEMSGHQQRDKDRSEECGHAVEDEGAAVDDEEDGGSEAKNDLHDEVAEDLLADSSRRWHSRVVAGRLEELERSCRASSDRSAAPSPGRYRRRSD